MFVQVDQCDQGLDHGIRMLIEGAVGNSDGLVLVALLCQCAEPFLLSHVLRLGVLEVLIGDLFFVQADELFITLLLGLQQLLELGETFQVASHVLVGAYGQQAQGDCSYARYAQSRVIEGENRRQPVAINHTRLFVHAAHFQQREASEQQRHKRDQGKAKARAAGNFHRSQEHLCIPCGSNKRDLRSHSQASVNAALLGW